MQMTIFHCPMFYQILEKVAKYEIYTFMDGNYDHNQLSIYPKDHHKTTFMMRSNIFIYVIIFFDLYNPPV